MPVFGLVKEYNFFHINLPRKHRNKLIKFQAIFPRKPDLYKSTLDLYIYGKHFENWWRFD